MTNNKTNTEKLITENRHLVEAVAKQYQNRGPTLSNFQQFRFGV
jgi:DNA-directed RNA polymerase specialized sigma subunit